MTYFMNDSKGGKHYVVKLADFGLAKDEKAVYKTPDPDLPVAWVAPECFQLCMFSIKSDVWSYGVLMWEIFSYGAEPFGPCSMPKTSHECPCPSLGHIQIQQHICKDQKTLLDMPAPCTAQFTELVTEIMRRCWQYEPKNRPSFEHLGLLLNEMNRE